VKSIDLGVLKLGPAGWSRNSRISAASSGEASIPSAGSMTALISSPPVVVGDAEHRRVADLREAEQDVLDLRRVDVGPRRRMIMSILRSAQEQVAVLVDEADVADGESICRSGLLSVLLLVLVVLEVGGLPSTCRRCR